jgi:methionine synthase II (cobalamin-independent)
MTALPPDLVTLVRARYQQVVGERKQDGAKRAEAVAQIADFLRQEGVELPDLYEQVVDAVVENLDDKDRLQQSDTLQWAADALDDQTILGTNDPILDRVCAVGRGIRKTYRYLDDDDLLSIASRKAKHAAEASAAAAATTELVRILLTAMRTRGARLLGELFATN